MTDDRSGILARGPWAPDAVEVSWRQTPYAPSADTVAAADAALQELRDRGSPSHDGLAARLRDFEVSDGRLRLDCEPVRWALRLLSGEGDAMQSLSALCVVRSADGQWLAGRRAQWLATWSERWALGAAGSVEVGENPADTLVRELEEEWSVRPDRLTIEALVKHSTGITMLIGQAWLAPEATVVPDAEHDDYAWWPADVAGWPEHADAPLRLTAELLRDAG